MALKADGGSAVNQQVVVVGAVGVMTEEAAFVFKQGRMEGVFGKFFNHIVAAGAEFEDGLF